MSELVDRMPVHAENFSLAGFMDQPAHTFARRFEEFRPFVEAVNSAGFVRREIAGPAAATVRVHGPASNSEREVVMLGSNNYLGLANEPEIVEAAVASLRKYGVGCGGPPLLNGTTSLHRMLEERLAAMKSCEAAIVFSSGYAANVGWVTGLLQKGDVLVYDEQSHASVYDGIQLGRIRSLSFAHNDLEHLRHRLKQVRWRDPGANVVVAVEGVYSMDGDVVPLPEVRALCDSFGALLAVDDAHGTGVLGERGRGTAEHFGLEGRVDLAMGTFSKVFATTGGFVAGTKDLVDWLRFFARPYMFSASLSPGVAASVLAAIDFVEAHPERVGRLRQNVAFLGRALEQIGFSVAPDAAIIPLVLPSHVPVRDVVAALDAKGVFVNGIEYPAVRRDQQRLRLSIMATHTEEQLEHSAAALDATAHRFAFHPESCGGR